MKPLLWSLCLCLLPLACTYARELAITPTPIAIAHNPFSLPMMAREISPSELTQAPVEVTYHLKALIEGASPFANINGKILAIGDNIDGFVLIRISQGRAVLKRNSEKLTLHLFDDRQANHFQ